MAMDSNRQIAENIDTVNQWVLKLQQIRPAGGIVPWDTWNMDEAGVQIGVG
jgi:hypothetical protein